jgi:hypothetical protein
MVVHIVMFKFADENKEQNILKAKEMLLQLEAELDIIKKMEVGINFDKSARAFDMSLYSKFESKEDLNVYATDEKHLKVVEFIKGVTLESKVSDYEL